MLAIKGMRFPIDIILVCIRWYAAYPLSFRHLEEMMEERGVFVDHLMLEGCIELSFADQFYALAGQIRPV